jgi:signal peptidase I
VKRIRLRPGLTTLAILMVAGVAWFYLAPIQIGGSSRYVVTSGISMEPRFHTGDLAIVRPVSDYRVGEIVAYWSNTLHAVVLHRIIARDGNTYEFKGDNNHFIDPDHPTRSELLGKLWLHVPHAGRILELFHTQVGAALLCVVVGLLTIFGLKESRRRRRRRRQGASGSGPTAIHIVNPLRDHLRSHLGALLIASAVAAGVFLALGIVAFSRPSSRTVATSTPYSQQVRFGYSAHVRPGLIYPQGTLTTGDPIFLTLVRNVTVSIDYALGTYAPSTVTGIEEVDLQLTGPGGWTRNLVLTPPTRFTGPQTSTEVTLDVPQLQSLVAKIDRLTGGTVFGGSTISVVPEVRVKGTVAGHPIDTSFAPALGFQLEAAQLVSEGVSTGASSDGQPSTTAPKVGYTQTDTGAVTAAPNSEPTTLAVLGVSPAISLLRWLAIIGFVISSASALYFYLRRRAEPFLETTHIQARYGAMIVPVLAGEDLGWPAVDVPTIQALVKLAQSGQRLILHSRAPGVDTYMVNDEGTVYRYQVRPSKVVWGDWSKSAEPPLEQAA